MATGNTTKNTTSANKQNAARKAASDTIAKEEKKEQVIIPKDIDTSQLIVVKNGFHGTLVYISSRTKEKFVWSGFGEEQEMELKELRAAKNTSKAFFSNNWFMFDDEYKWVVDYLGVRQYYENAVSIEEIDNIFDKTPATIEKLIGKMTNGQKSSLAYRARELVVNGEIDSLKTISALEKSLGIELIER